MVDKKPEIPGSYESMSLMWHVIFKRIGDVTKKFHFNGNQRSKGSLHSKSSCKKIHVSISDTRSYR